jgi:hypothetical protein
VEKRNKEKGKLHTINLKGFGSRKYYKKGKPSFKKCQPKLLRVEVDDDDCIGEDQWTRFSRPVTALAYPFMWFVVGAQCRFIIKGMVWCAWKR